MRDLSTRSRVLSLATILGLVGLALLVAGCGSSTTTSSASPSASPSATSTAAAPWTAADLAAITTDSSLTALLPADIQSSGVIKCLSDIPYPPWEYFDPPTSTNPAGFDFDMSQALGKKLGVEVKFIDSTFESILLKIKGGQGDMALSAMYDNEERQKAGYSFVDYTFDGTGILVAKGNPNGITGLDSLAGKTVAVESGATQVVVLQELNKDFQSAGESQMQILSLPDQPAALLAVKSNRAVADLTDFSTAVDIATTNDGNTFEVVRDPAAPYEPQMNGMAVLATNTQLVDALQKALQALIDEGSYQKLVAAWGFVPVESAQVNQGPAYAASHAGLPVSPSP